MSAIPDTMADLVAALTMLGIPATSEPELVLPNISEAGMCALVGPPTVRLQGLSGALDMDIPVHIACAPPGGYTQFVPVWERLPSAMAVFGQSEGRPVGLPVGDQILPAYQFTVTTTVQT